MSNPFETRTPTLNGPARDIFPVTPSDAADLVHVATALYVETGGTLVVETVSGLERTVVVGDLSILPVGVKRVLATGTTASGIHAFTVA